MAAKPFRLGWPKITGGAKWISPAILVWLITAISVAQELPSGGGPIPALRRGAGGQIELAPSSAAPRKEAGRPDPAVDGPAPPSGKGRVRSPSASASAPQRSPQPVITVIPTTPRVSDTAPLGAVVASYSVAMSDGSPFTGTVRFAAPNFDANRRFAISGDKIIVNPNGPGLGRQAATSTYRITLETVP